MKLRTSMQTALLAVIFSFFAFPALSQVKIGGDPKEAPHPSSVLELKSTDKGFLLPRLSTEQINAIADPADGLIVYDSTQKAVMIFNRNQHQWLSLLQPVANSVVPGDSCEWAFDTTTLRVFLKRGYPAGDSIYYNTARKKFVFTDKPSFGGGTVPADVQFPGKFMVKGSASSIFNDSASLNFPSLTLANFLFEVDQDSFAVANPGLAFYNGMRVSTQVLPTATQRISTVRAMNLQVNNTAADSVNAVTSVVSNSFLDGRGFTSQFSGFQNNMAVGETVQGVGTVTGYRSTISGPGISTTRVNGNLFGYLGSVAGFTDSAGNYLINGNAYGVFLNSISGAAPKRNYAFYSNKGHNRFADSTLITDGFFTSPRAVLDINSTSAMITPAGTTVQRPAAPIAAMLRYNTTLSSMEYYNGTAWKSFSGDSSEWKFDGTTSRVNLVRGLPVNDTIFYNPVTRKFVYSDRYTNTNSLGQDFPVDAFGAKYTFKGTASQRTDSTQLDGPVTNFVYEVDNASAGTVFNNIQAATVMNPKAFQKADQLSGISNNVIHAGNDSVQALIGITNQARNSGNGSSGTITGMLNSVRILNGTANNTGELIGIRNILSRGGATAGRVTGNVYGIIESFSGFSNNIDGNIYGVFVGPVTGAAPRKNFAFYSNQGHNHFGDSVVITDNGTINPRAIFDINSTSAMITPAGTSAQRPGAPLAAMLRYNSTGSVMEFFNGTSWKALSSDTAEWQYDAALGRVNLVRGLPVVDTIFYNPQRRQFVFSDRHINTNSLNQDFPVEDFGAKFTFKTTASQRTDSFITNGSNVNIVYEADNSALNTVYNALSTSTVINPKALQKSDQATGITNTVIHAGNDSAQVVIGISNVARNSGNGKAGSITGIQNIVRIQNGVANNAGELVGVRTTVGRTGATAGRVTGNVYGWLGTFTGLTNNVDGNIYGIFLNSVTGAAARKNFAFYSNKGLNRLGDSVLITDGAAVTPRAVLDVNATSAMIVPTGTSAQRPTAPVTGMVRYNTDNGGRVESFNGSSWSGILSNAIAIDPPNMPAGTGTTMSVTFTGATIGSAVAISPSVAPPAGITIAWARVSAANTVEVRFENNSGAPVNPASITYYIKVIQ